MLSEFIEYEHHYMTPEQFDRCLEAIERVLLEQWAQDKREAIQTDLQHDDDMR